MGKDEQEQLRQRYRLRCGYCGVSETDVGAKLTVDHFQPRSKGGLHVSTNWVYCCHACNEFKADIWFPRDSTLRILHPLRDDLSKHIVEQAGGTLRSLTETGQFHIQTLQLNRRQLIAYRRERCLLEDARRTKAGLLRRIRQLENQVQLISNQLMADEEEFID